MTEADANLSIDIPVSQEGMRVDKALAELLPEYSRSAIQQWLKQKRVDVSGKSLKPSDKLSGSEQVNISIPAIAPADWVPQKMELAVQHQDDHLLVLNKPAGLVVHPGAGNPDHTLLNGLIHFDPILKMLPRAGIVHRLDKDTTGLMVIARTEIARQNLIEQLKLRTVRRQYLAVTNGVPVTGETIDAPIGRKHHDRLRMAVTDHGKPAITHVRVRQKFRSHCLLQANLETGRTHQIRVHLSWRGYPLIGDSLYGGRPKVPPHASTTVIQTLQGFSRQALHAEQLELVHPESNQTLQWQCPLPPDMEMLLQALTEDTTEYS